MNRRRLRRVWWRVEAFLDDHVLVGCLTGLVVVPLVILAVGLAWWGLAWLLAWPNQNQWAGILVLVFSGYLTWQERQGRADERRAWENRDEWRE